MFFYLLRLNMKRCLAYKLDFSFKLGSVIIWISAGVFNMYLINFNFNRFENWNFYELNLLYAIWSLTFGIYNAFGNSILDFDKLTITGKIDIFLITPCSPLFLITFSKINIMGLGFILFGILSSTFSIISLRIALEKIIFLFLYSILGGVLIYSIFLIFASLSFFGTKSRELLRLGYNIHKFSQYPLSIYQEIPRIIFGYIFPFAFSNYLPVSLTLGKIENIWVKLLCFTIPILLFIVAYIFFNFSLTKYEGTGS